ASALASNYSPPPEDSLLAQTGDIATFRDWFCKKRGITELKPQYLEGPAYELVKVFCPDMIRFQYQMEECRKLLTDRVDDPILRHNVSKPLPLGGPPGQVTIQSDFFFNNDLEYLRYDSKGRRPTLSILKIKATFYPAAGLEQMVPNQFWIEEEWKYDIAAIVVGVRIGRVVHVCNQKFVYGLLPVLSGLATVLFCVRVSYIHEVVNSQETAIHSSLEHSKIVTRHRYNIPFFINLNKHISLYALDILFEEYTRCVDGLGHEICECQLRTSYWIPCSHEQLVYTNKGYPIPLEAIDRFWRKLNLSPCASLGDDDLGCQVKVEVENFNTEFKKQSRAGKKSLLRKMKEITTPLKTSLNEPATQKATGGRSSFKRSPADQPSQTQEPAGYNFSSVRDVKADGNYGFREVVVSLKLYENKWTTIRYDLMEELCIYYYHYVVMFGAKECDDVKKRLNFFKNGFAPIEKWMNMPEIGFLIASRYNVIFHNITLHYVNVLLQGDNTVPTIASQWFHYRNESGYFQHEENEIRNESGYFQHEENEIRNESNYVSRNKSKFETDTVFNSRQDLIDWVKETELSIGYVIVIKRSKATEHVSFHCDVGDRESALMKAYDTAFPNAKGLLCRWHINKSVMRKCKKMIKHNKTWYYFSIAWNTLVNSHNEEAYQLNLEQLQEIIFEFLGSMTYMPLRLIPPPWYDHKFITLGYVNRSHYVNVLLQGDYLVPTIASHWFRYRFECAVAWITPYLERINYYNQLLRSNGSTRNVKSY
nr:hypothetical protein [Tanacetum cinerariifolium]